MQNICGTIKVELESAGYAFFKASDSGLWYWVDSIAGEYGGENRQLGKTVFDLWEKLGNE